VIFRRGRGVLILDREKAEGGRKKKEGKREAGRSRSGVGLGWPLLMG